MTKRIPRMLWIPLVALPLMAAANGAWLQKVPAAERATINPVAGSPEHIAAGEKLYQENCARCHGADGNGRTTRPPVRSPRVAAATDGELAWMLKNGQPFRGMPAWATLPEAERWQIISYLRSIQAPVQDAPGTSTAGK
jgi:mono/diheme cytochrome c family protein